MINYRIFFYSKQYMTIDIKSLRNNKQTMTITSIARQEANTIKDKPVSLETLIPFSIKIKLKVKL